jgi:hypothetical protein
MRQEQRAMSLVLLVMLPGKLPLPAMGSDWRPVH